MVRQPDRATMQFKCPICSCPEYQRVVVPRAHGTPYETDFLCCLGCSAMFIDPELFTAATAFRVEVEGAARATGAPEASLQSHALREHLHHISPDYYVAA